MTDPDASGGIRADDQAPSTDLRKGDHGRLLVVHLVTRLNVGGVAVQVLALSQALARGGRVMVAHGEVDQAESEMAASSGENLEIVSLPGLRKPIGVWDLVAGVRIWRLLRRARPVVLHTHMSKAGALGRVAAALLPAKDRPAVVHTYHGSVLDQHFGRAGSRAVAAVERMLAKRSSLLVAVSESVRADLLRWRIAPPEKIRVIPLGLDLGRFHEAGAARDRQRREFLAELGIPPEALVVACVGRLTRIKRVDRFLRVAARLSGDERLHFLVVGDGEAGDQLRASDEALALEGRVSWTGMIADVERAYAASDVVVMTSDNEGTPVSLLEAQAAGVPVVTTAVGGTPDAIVAGVTGLLVDRADEEALSGAVAELCDDDARRRAMGVAGSDFVRARFSIEALTRRTQEVYAALSAYPRAGGSRGVRAQSAAGDTPDRRG